MSWTYSDTQAFKEELSGIALGLHNIALANRYAADVEFATSAEDRLDRADREEAVERPDLARPSTGSRY